MRHRVKRHQLSRPADQRRALLRTLATSFVTHGEVVTTLARAKALQPIAEKLITWGKKGDVHSIRQAGRFLYNNHTGETVELPNGKTIPQRVLRKLVQNIAPQFATRPGGYTRLIQMPPRRGDAAPMAILVLSPEGFEAKPKKEKPKKEAKAPKAETAPAAAVVEEAPVEAVVEETVVAEEAPAAAPAVEEAPAAEETPEA